MPQNTTVIILSCGIKISAVRSFVSSQSKRVTDRWTDGQTNGRDSDPEDCAIIAALHGKNEWKGRVTNSIDQRHQLTAVKFHV